MSLALFASLFAASSVVVLPVHAPNPPPQDPTLLRMSHAITEAIHSALGAEVRLVSREQRDEICPQEDGVCPNDVAARFEADRAVALVLAKDYSALRLRVYHGKLGLEREGKIPCAWNDGAVDCETAKIAAIFEGASANALGEGEVEKTFAALAPKIEKCKKLDAGEANAPAEAWINFRVRPDGRVYDVRIDPRELGERRGYNCIALLVESMKLRKFSGEVQTFRFDLLAHPKGEPPPPAKKKKARSR